MTYVLDSSVALKWVMVEADSTKAIRLRDDFLNGFHELIAPDLFLPEVANGLASAERQGRIGAGEAIASFLDIVRTAPDLHASRPHLARAIPLAIAHRRAVYDFTYLALAEAEGCEFITADDQFARGLRTTFPFIRLLNQLP
ncbi:MAG: type II toxin-antitoxin system VapC family toxin [Gemmataceae bacterium]